MRKYYSAIKKWGNPTICDNMNGFEGIMLSEISQKKTNTIWFHLYVKLGGKKAKYHPPQTHRKREKFFYLPTYETMDMN